MSKFRDSITLSIFSLSTLSNYHYWQSPKTRYWRLVRPYQTGIPPARLLALVWAHNPDLLNTFLFPTFLSFGQEVSLALLGQCQFQYPVCTFTHYSTTYFLTLHYIFSYAILGEPSAIWIIPHFLKPFFMIRCCMTILSSCVSILRWLIFSLQNSTDILKIP